jgi:hypothetical protein
MTLILSLATPDWVAAVADRRLSRKSGKLADDNATKVVMFCNQMAFCYTGRSEIEGKPTDRWLRSSRGCPLDRSLQRATTSESE